MCGVHAWPLSISASALRAASKYSLSASSLTEGWVPNADNRGICLVRLAQRESIVCTCSREAFSMRSQFRRPLCTRTLRARSHVNRSCSCSGGASSCARSRLAKILLRISPAALCVNVMARISSGSSARARRDRNRCVNNPVLPDPAGACTINERVTSSAD